MINPNEPIYPIKQAGEYDYSGLTKREHFAILIMQGLSSMEEKNSEPVSSMEEAWQMLAEQSVIGADALIKALNNKP